MKKFLMFALCLITFGCESPLKQHPAPEASPQVIETVVMQKEDKKLSVLDLWIQSAYKRVVRNFYTTGDLFGESVKIQVNLDDDGFISSYKIISTTGSERLNYNAVTALKKTEPFDLSKLSESAEGSPRI